MNNSGTVKAGVKVTRKNKKKIQDLINMPREDFLKKYNIKPQAVGPLHRSKLFKELAAKATATPKPERRIRVERAVGKVGASQLPKLPPWSDNWDPSVQEEWLKTCLTTQIVEVYGLVYDHWITIFDDFIKLAISLSERKNV
jgi:hypothetical protein